MFCARHRRYRGAHAWEWFRGKCTVEVLVSGDESEAYMTQWYSGGPISISFDPRNADELREALVWLYGGSKVEG